MSRDVRSVLLVAVLAMGIRPALLLAQVASGQLTGVVRDPADEVVPGATVTATNVATNVPRSVVTTSDGVYSLTGLLPGEYRVDVELSGFKTERRSGVQIATGTTTRLDFSIAVGNVTEEVVVHAPTTVLREESASLGMVVDNDKVVNLPLNGRSYTTLTALVPGVALPPNSQLPRINGGRPRTNEYLYDGISVLQPEPGQVAYFPIIDAIQEFKVESNSPPAEFGRFNGGVINLTTKAGTNTFHGNVFEFFRNEGLNGTNYFQQNLPSKPEYRRSQFGGTAGGPIVENHTFFFADYQGQRQDIGRTVLSTVPTLLQRQGVFTEAIGGKVPVIYDPSTTVPNGSGGFTRMPFAGNTIPVGQMDPVAMSLVSRYPLPTSSGTTNNYQRTAAEIDDQDQFDLRIDHRFNGKNQLFGRLSYFYESFVPVTPLPDGSGVTTGTLGPQKTTAWAFASNFQHVFSNRWFNELRIGDTRRAIGRTAAQLSTTASAGIGIPGIPSYAQFPNTLPTFLIGGYQQLGSPMNTASDFSTGVSEIADSVSWLKGKHAFKAGLDWRWERLNVIQPPYPTGVFMFNTLGSDLPGTTGTGTPFASFLLGQVQNFSIDLQRQQIRNRAHFQEYFFQDDWKVSDRWSISPGLRYTLNFPSTEENNQSAVFNLQTQQLQYLGRDGFPTSARELQKNGFGPRLGITGRLSDKTIFSGGYALVWIEQAGITTPFTTPAFPFLQTVTQPALDNVTPAFVLAHGPTVTPVGPTPYAGLGQGVFTVDADLGSGYVQQANVALQRELTGNTVVEVAYVASKITHVGIPDSNINQLTVDQLAIGDPLQVKVPNPYYGIIPPSSSLGGKTISQAQLMKPFPEYTSVAFYRNNVGTTFYQGVELSLRHRMSRGLSYSVSYTRSALKDDASQVFDASILTGPMGNYPVADAFNRTLERDYSTGDIPNYFVSSVTWDLPWGSGRSHPLHGLAGAIASDWTTTGIVTLESGVPIAVTQVTNFNAFAGFTTQRPNIIGDVNLPSDQRTPAHWFNTAAFQQAPIYTLGNASRNPVRGPAYQDVDLAFMRRVPTGGGRYLELRAEIFNLLNTAQFNAPGSVVGTPTFGVISSALDPRVVQLAMKFWF